MSKVAAKLSLFVGGGSLIMIGCGVVVGGGGKIMTGCGWSWVVATKICPVVGTGCEFMPGLGWSQDLVILQAFVFSL